jgi:integrative and conjugative element protein (TIGR02256 family)
MRVNITDEVRIRLVADMKEAGEREVGGLLMGEQLAKDHFLIMDYSIDPTIGTHSHFTRDPAKHYAALEDFFERTGHEYERFNYLGEWHSHPLHPVLPSRDDITSMVSIVTEEPSITFAFLMIVQASLNGALGSSLTLLSKQSNDTVVVQPIWNKETLG